MKKKLEVAVIGLGKFGLNLGASLVEQGHYVVGVDTSEQRIRIAQDMLSKVYVGDATDKQLLEQLRIQDFNAVAVSTGNSMEASILTVMNLLDLGVRHIIAKAISPEHQKVLRRIGVQQVIQPEVDVAIQTALRLTHPGMLDFLPLGGGIMLQELTVGSWAGQSLMELDLRNRYGVMVVAVKGVHDAEYTFVPAPTTRFSAGDTLVVVGKHDSIKGIVS
ncbi:potassium channel family protein [Desulfovibrio cuneatus]|uniref:potassium channel family protein n=1 Tax=Desulfovibrio cuneatus TaxID=159728 RepID=UPI0003FB78FA|nr:TrkA family potassium uptake protein [Desulfovibrio cuneatus]